MTSPHSGSRPNRTNYFRVKNMTSQIQTGQLACLFLRHLAKDRQQSARSMICACLKYSNDGTMIRKILRSVRTSRTPQAVRVVRHGSQLQERYYLEAAV
jgi:hypothetical protein